ncbi:MAG TPA: hypothetical protein VHE83_10945, partial [Mycobacteriales bacterium]|nr:hypothetical protein [Mycobacteriales bacterium]
RAARPRARAVTVVTVDPPRAAHAAAVGARLARSRDYAGVARPLQRATRARLTRRAGLSWDASPEELRLASTRLGVPEGLVDVILREPDLREEVVDVGRALAAVSNAAAPGAIRSQS